ncbi:hypothetical protein [Angustibacter luteus]|uniref:Twin-arginine translocation signal domain-containing protein n=1 Tax=Angustibacter luteus TaxID=658456 RepID=A0ABW1JII3_9ACTN
MNEHTRRTFLIGTGAAAAVGTAAAAGAAPATAVAGPDADPSSTRPPGSSTPGPVVAYVSDADSGQVTVMRGDDEVVLTDHDLARRLTGQVR